MKVYEILETFEIQPAQTLDKNAKQVKAYNVIDTKTGLPVKTFQGPDADGKAEEYRDQQNKLRTANKTKPVSKDTDSDTDKSKNPKVNKKAGIKMRVAKALGKIFMLGGKSSLVGVIFTASEMQPVAEDWAIAYAANGCKLNIHEDPSIGLTTAKSKEHVGQMLYRQKEATAIVSGGIAATLTAIAAKGARMAGVAKMLGMSIPPAGPAGIVAKILAFVAAGVTWFALPFLIG